MQTSVTLAVMNCNNFDYPIKCNQQGQDQQNHSARHRLRWLIYPQLKLLTSSVAGLLIFGNFGLFGSFRYGGTLAAPTAPTAAPKQDGSCPAPALSRLRRHTVASGETLTSIAQQYDLLPTTLMGLNPVLRQGKAPVGTEIVIPPYNGIRVTVPAGSSWRDIAQQYNVRADVLYEMNGCQNTPSVVFIPGVNWSPVPTAAASSAASPASPVSRYPLPEVASILLAYGWQVNPATNAVEFHGGVNLAAAAGTPVIAAGAGTVAFAGAQQGYGNLVVINHLQGLQTRYSQLATVSVKTGQQIQAGTQIGTVGATTAEPYLHFEVRLNSQLGWVAQDPGVYIPELRVGRASRQYE